MHLLFFGSPTDQIYPHLLYTLGSGELSEGPRWCRSQSPLWLMEHPRLACLTCPCRWLRYACQTVLGPKKTRLDSRAHTRARAVSVFYVGQGVAQVQVFV